MDSKIRVGIDISMFAFIIGASFNAGITYNKLDQTNARVAENERSIKQLERDQQPLSERVARMEAILQDIRDELRAQNEKHTP